MIVSIVGTTTAQGNDPEARSETPDDCFVVDGTLDSVTSGTMRQDGAVGASTPGIQSYGLC